ncbi:MAG: hypothetical protein WC623_19955 [Pedobacter sp.]|uniref:hypothetical protein n=1 Tax=Pedobacter sp. TaxID=1411316 RepID=UPI003563331A
MAITKTALAQNDYIVTLKNDTLRGEVKNTLFGYKHRFKETGQSKSNLITVKNTKLYSKISNKKVNTYEARILPDKKKPIFMELLEKGDINLYELIVYNGGMNGSTTTNWYASKGSGPLFSLKTSALAFNRADKEKSFEQLLSDNPALWANFKAEKSFSFKVLRKYINLYNHEKIKTVTSE